MSYHVKPPKPASMRRPPRPGGSGPRRPSDDICRRAIEQLAREAGVTAEEFAAMVLGEPIARQCVP